MARRRRFLVPARSAEPAGIYLPLPQQGKPVYGVGSNMQGDVVLVALDEVKAGSMPEEQKKAMVQGSPRTMPKSLSKR